jgi:hypothetical protein
LILYYFVCLFSSVVLEFFQDIIKPEDVFGRGKRCRTPKTDAIYTSDYDHDFDPKEETRARSDYKCIHVCTDYTGRCKSN